MNGAYWVEITAISGLTAIAIVALIFGKSTEVAAAAVGGIAGYITHKMKEKPKEDVTQTTQIGA